MLRYIVAILAVAQHPTKPISQTWIEPSFQLKEQFNEDVHLKSKFLVFDHT